MSEKIKVFIGKFRQLSFFATVAFFVIPAKAGIYCYNKFKLFTQGFILNLISLTSKWIPDKFLRRCYEIFRNDKKSPQKHFLMMAVVVFLIAVSVSIPVHQAQAWDPLGDAVSLGMSAFFTVLSKGGELLLNFIFAILVAVLNIGLELSALLVMFGAWLIDAMLDPRLYVGDPAAAPPVPGVLTSSTITVGWTTVRDMCNTFYVFFLLIIAFGTILRSSTFNAKNLLPKLVISLFLINFSAEITKLVIDFGQVFMYGIMSWMGTFQEGGGTLTSIVDQFKNEINGAGWQANFDQVVRVAFALAYSVVLGLTYVMLALFLLVRLVAFVILIILSPIAFLSIVMPSMGKYTSEWWGELVKYSIFGPIFMFFVYLSATMANELVTNFTPLTVTGTALNPITGIISVMVPHAVALMMLLAVVPVTQRLGVAGAGKIIGGTAGFGKIAMGGYSGAKKTFGFGKKAGGVVANRSEKVGGLVDKGKKGYADMLGKVGLHGSKMRYNANQEKEKEKNLKDAKLELVGDIDLKSADLESMKKAANQTGARKEYGALVLQTAAAQGKLGDIPEGDKKKYMTSTNRYMGGKDMDELTNKDLQLATMTNDAQARIATPSDKGMADDLKTKFTAATTKGEQEDLVKEQIMREKMNDIVETGDASKVQGLGGSAMATRAWHESQESDPRKSNTSRMNKKQKAELAKGYEKNINRSDFDDVKNIEFRTNKAKLTNDLEEAFQDASGMIDPFNMSQIREVHKAVGQLDHKFINKLDSSSTKGRNNLELIGNHVEEGTLKKLEIKETPDDNIMAILKEIKNNRAGSDVDKYAKSQPKYAGYYNRLP